MERIEKAAGPPAAGSGGPLRRNAANPRYFTDDSARAIYLTGSPTWAVMQDMWLESRPRRELNYPAFLDMLEEHGHTFLRFWQWMHPRNARWSSETTLFDPQPHARTGPGAANDGLPRFDLSRWNGAYFERLRDRVEAAGRRGLYVGVMLFESWTIKGTTPEQDPWPFHPMHPDNNVNGVTDDPTLEEGPGRGRAWDLFSLRCPQLLHWQKEYVKKVVDTLNDLHHVLYEISNEVPNRPEAMAWQDHLCAFIQDYERGKPKRHPVGITAEGGNQDNAQLFATGADWISPGNGPRFEYRYNPPPADGRKVILTDTDHLWGHGAEVAWVWKSFTRGLNVLFMDPWEPIPADMPGWVLGLGGNGHAGGAHAGDALLGERRAQLHVPVEADVGPPDAGGGVADVEDHRHVAQGEGVATEVRAQRGRGLVPGHQAGKEEQVLEHRTGMMPLRWCRCPADTSCPHRGTNGSAAHVATRRFLSALPLGASATADTSRQASKKRVSTAPPKKTESEQIKCDFRTRPTRRTGTVGHDE
jgi:hypothetical protein